MLSVLVLAAIVGGCGGADPPDRDEALTEVGEQQAFVCPTGGRLELSVDGATLTVTAGRRTVAFGAPGTRLVHPDCRPVTGRRARRGRFGAGLGAVSTGGRLRCRMPETVRLSLGTTSVEHVDWADPFAPMVAPTRFWLLDPRSRRILAKAELSGNAGRVVALRSCRGGSRPG